MFAQRHPLSPRGLDLASWVQSPYPPNTHVTIQQQLQCYALPYGLIGFISHLLTYLTMFLLARGRDPLFPWRFLRHKKFNMVISAVGLVTTVVVTLLTMMRCRNGWQLILVATWKLLLSLTLSIMAINAATLIDWGRIKGINSVLRGGGDGNGSKAGLVFELDKATGVFRKIMVRSPFLLFGGVVGFVGIVNLVKGNIGSNAQLRIITYVFAGAAGVVTLATMVCALAVYPSQRYLSSNIFGSFLFGCVCCLVCLTVLFALYSDWVLGTLAEDLTGAPSQDVVVFYVTYFMAKRLPMFSC